MILVMVVVWCGGFAVIGMSMVVVIVLYGGMDGDGLVMRMVKLPIKIDKEIVILSRKQPLEGNSRKLEYL